MNDIKNVLDKYNYRTEKISIIGKAKIVETENEKLVVKQNNGDIKDVFVYLEGKGFHNYLDYLNEPNDKYLIFPYINSITKEDSDKAKDLITIVALLHSKTYFYKSISVDEIKKMYEEKTEHLDYLDKYYDNLRFYIEEQQFPSPSNYYLLRNISWIFHSISSSKYFLDKWYDIVKDKKNNRVGLIHGNLELNHLLESNKKVIISWDGARNDLLIYDLIYLYKKNYNDVDFYNLFKLYESYFPLLPEERFLLFSLMLEPDKLKLDDIEILNMKKCYYQIKYLQTSSAIISNYHSEKTNDEDNKEKK